MISLRIAVLAVVLAAVLNGRPLFALGQPELDLELDPYYSALGITVPFSKGAADADAGKSEIHTYRDMLTRALVPRFMVLEVSVNPLPLAGVLIRECAENFYQDMQLSPTLNLVEALTAGFEEPYALALFLGKVIDFDQGKKSLARSKKGYIGYLASAGNYHIMNSLLIPDNWLEAEWKIKGDQKTESRRMSWSFRGGAKFHSNREVLDVYYIGIRRTRTDFAKSKYSFLLSSAIEYRVDFSHKNFKPVSHYVLVEKNFPLSRRKWIFSIGIGYLWKGPDKYSGSLALQRRKNEEQILLRPNLRF